MAFEVMMTSCVVSGKCSKKTIVATSSLARNAVGAAGDSATAAGTLERQEVCDSFGLMTHPDIGFPERWAAFNQRNDKFVTDCYPGLVKTAEKMLNRHVSIKTVGDDIIFLLGRTAFEDYCELWVLAGNGYGIGAYKILRGLYEKVVTLGYLVKHQSEIQRFCDYEIVQRKRLMNRVKEDPHVRARFSKAAYEEIDKAHEAIKGQFLDAKGRSLSWTDRK